MKYAVIMIPLLVLSSGPAYADWLWIDNGKPGMTIYVNPDTIRRNKDLVKIWQDKKMVRRIVRALRNYLGCQEMVWLF